MNKIHKEIGSINAISLSVWRKRDKFLVHSLSVFFVMMMMMIRVQQTDRQSQEKSLLLLYTQSYIYSTSYSARLFDRMPKMHVLALCIFCLFFYNFSLFLLLQKSDLAVGSMTINSARDITHLEPMIPFLFFILTRN